MNHLYLTLGLTFVFGLFQVASGDLNYCLFQLKSRVLETLNDLSCSRFLNLLKIIVIMPNITITLVSYLLFWSSSIALLIWETTEPKLNQVKSKEM